MGKWKDRSQKLSEISLFAEIFQVCTVIPELIFCIPFDMSAVACFLHRGKLGNLSFYSLQNTVEQ